MSVIDHPAPVRPVVVRMLESEPLKVRIDVPEMLLLQAGPSTKTRHSPDILQICRLYPVPCVRSVQVVYLYFSDGMSGQNAATYADEYGLQTAGFYELASDLRRALRSGIEHPHRFARATGGVLCTQGVRFRSADWAVGFGWRSGSRSSAEPRPFDTKLALASWYAFIRYL